MPAWVSCRIEENHHQERPNLDIPPQLSLEEELPSGQEIPSSWCLLFAGCAQLTVRFAAWLSMQGQLFVAALTCWQAALALSGCVCAVMLMCVGQAFHCLSARHLAVFWLPSSTSSRQIATGNTWHRCSRRQALTRCPGSMPAVPQTPVTQNPEKVEEKKNSFMGRLLGVGA